MNKKLLLIIVLSIFLALLGVHLYSPSYVESQRTARPLLPDKLGADNEVSPVVAQPELPSSGPDPSEIGDASSVGSNSSSWDTRVQDLIKKTFHAASSRRPPMPPTRRDFQRQDMQVGGSNQQESTDSSISKANPLPKQKSVPGISVRCNISRPSCRRWLFLQKKKSRRKKALAENKISE